MDRDTWKSLKPGDIIASIRSGIEREVIDCDGSNVKMRLLSNPKHFVFTDARKLYKLVKRHGK